MFNSFGNNDTADIYRAWKNINLNYRQYDMVILAIVNLKIKNIWLKHITDDIFNKFYNKIHQTLIPQFKVIWKRNVNYW